uniref:Feline leukemia virus subgroup C receptor-related protein 2-like n=1 Tax=Phallusia mammillata TaxID=59560 RepID=A0A6F9DDI3_9ASCI|nr:feline leukemia virus subgroup C receptor-related protein 2-like [Phallusia mammillata]
MVQDQVKDHMATSSPNKTSSGEISSSTSPTLSSASTSKQMKDPLSELDSDSDEEALPVKLYTRRWVVLAIAAFSISMRGYNQSCFGVINNIYAEYFGVMPWQIDWFVVIQSVIFLFMSLPMTLVTKRLNYKLSICFITSSLTIGFAVTACGITTNEMGYGVVLGGQAVMGFSNILSWSIQPATAALWFSSSEVAIAIAVQVVARGIGEALGCIVPPLVANEKSTHDQVKYGLLSMFIGLGSFAFLLFVLCLTIVKKRPPLPPSVAQAKLQAIKREPQDFKTSMSKFYATIKTLFKDKNFVTVWFVFGAINPVLRTSNILLTSMLRGHFKLHSDLNFQVGIVLMVAWFMYTVGGFISGPLISKTRRYKEIVLANVILICITCIMLTIGIIFNSIYLVYFSVAAQGLFLGLANASIFELLIEVTYPQPAMFVTMLAIVIMGLFRLGYPLIGRAILKFAGPPASTSFPIAMTLVCAFLLIILKPEYKREIANRPPDDSVPLISQNSEIRK